MTEIELLAAALGVLAVWLTIRQNPWCWPIGLAMVVIYSWLFYEVKLYSDMLLQGVFAVLQLYGWWQWTRGGQHQHGRGVHEGHASFTCADIDHGQGVKGAPRSTPDRHHRQGNAGWP